MLLFLIAFLLVFLLDIHHYVTLEYIHTNGNMWVHYFPFPVADFASTTHWTSRLLYKCPVPINTTHTIHHIHSYCLFLLIVLVIQRTKLNFIINLGVDGRFAYSLSLSRNVCISAQIFNMFY